MKQIIKQLHYNEFKNPRSYTEKQVEEMYYKFYFITLQNCLSILKYAFIPIKNIKINTRKILSWDVWFQDNFLRDTKGNKFKLAESIKKNGSYWPLQVFETTPNNYYIYEGQHRLESLKLAQLEGLIDNNFELLTVILPQDYLYKVFIDKLNITYKPINIYYSLDLNPKVEGQQINEYTAYKSINTLQELDDALNNYPLFLRDLLYKYPNIKPNKIINNKKLWYENYNSGR